MGLDHEIRELAYAIWEREGRPEGKHQQHYFRAKAILEERMFKAAEGGALTPPTQPATPPTDNPARRPRVARGPRAK